MPLPATTSEQRMPLYTDVEDLTETGFLSHSIVIAGTIISLRSLCSKDLFILKSFGSDSGWQTWLIAASIWLVDGYNFLDESNSLYHLHKSVIQMPLYVQEILFSIVKGLFSRQNQALQAVEAYCYENVSRFRWKAFKGVSVPMGFGLNPVMQMWRFFNEIEDKRIYDETQWDGFKLAASASSPKGVEKIDKADRDRRDQEKNHRQDLLDKFYYIKMGVISENAEYKPDTVSLSLRSKTVDVLEQEMQMWVKGEYDFHDRVVNNYKNKITQGYQEDYNQRESRKKDLHKKWNELELSTKKQPLIGLTLEQLDDVLKDRKPGVAKVFSGQYGLQDKMYQRHLQEADTGLLEVGNDGIVSPEVDKDLMELITKRSVPFSSED